MDISIVIVSWNAKRFLEECLTSLIATPWKHSVEIIVVDNASTDGSPELVQLKFPDVRLIQNSENLGFAAANNVGIYASAGRYISLINSDVRVLPDCLDGLADYLDQHPDVGNVGPTMLNADMSLQSSCRSFPTLWNNLCEACGLAKAFPRSRLFSGEHMLFFSHDRTLDVEVLVGCFWMVRREAFESVGLLDEEFFMYAEDVDWCKRCWIGGWRIVFVPQGRAIHYRGGSSVNDPVRFSVEQQRSILRYWSKHHTLLGRLGIASVLLFKHLVRYVVGAISRLLKGTGHGDDLFRMRVNIACMEALISGNRVKKA